MSSMSLPQWIGYVTAMLDSLGLTPYIQAVMLLGLALWAYHRFFGDRD